MLCRNFQRITTCNLHCSWSMIVICSPHYPQSLSYEQKSNIVTYSNVNHINSFNYNKINIFHHQHRDITLKTIMCGGSLIYLIKKFIGIKFLQWYGWKRLYRLNHRRTRIMIAESDDKKKEKSKKMMKYYSKFARKSYDFFVRHPKLIENWLLIDGIIINTLLYIPRKLKLGLHRWLAVQIDLHKKKKKSNPMLTYPKQWNGPIMFDINYMVGYTNIIILSQYVLIAMYEKRLLFDVAFVISNQSHILALNQQIEQKWRENPIEYERKQYVKLSQLK